MSNKTRLQTNNINLQALINKANALPEAGGGSGGGSIETYTGKLVASSSAPGFMQDFTITYTDNTMTVINLPVSGMTSECSFTAAKNTIVFIVGGLCNATSGCTRLGGGTGSYGYLLTDNNFIITASM